MFRVKLRILALKFGVIRFRGVVIIKVSIPGLCIYICNDNFNNGVITKRTEKMSTPYIGVNSFAVFTEPSRLPVGLAAVFGNAMQMACILKQATIVYKRKGYIL